MKLRVAWPHSHRANWKYTSVQPPQCHLVGSPHITHLRTDLQKNVGVWYFLFIKLLWSKVTIYWAQSEPHTAGFKAPWWAHKTTIQLCTSERDMRKIYPVAMLGLHRGSWWYISSLPSQCAAKLKRRASPNASRDLTQFVWKLNLSKKYELNE